ncbi:GDP-D-glucose phosphorylase 1-like [Pocillopora verrucosa]|uniref:GDP-D-glucose phosphorylase 1-like n=1 Tax=Pocillopora verrucosa TaxID=203993 RepID=UPI00333EEF4D
MRNYAVKRIVDVVKRRTVLCCRAVNPNFMSVSSTQVCSSEQQFSYIEKDFHWPCRNHNCDEILNEPTISEFDEELQKSWNAAVNAGYFTYKLDHTEGRIALGKYHLYIQLNELRFSKRRKPDPINKVSQPFDPSKFNFTKVQQKEVMFELIPKHRSTVTSDQHVLIINNSPIEYGHSLLVPSINSCLPQILTEEALLLSMETAMLSSHRGLRVGFNSLCAYSSVNHLHFHIWYSEHPSYLETVDVIPLCKDVFEVRDYATNTLVFELGPQSDVSLLARKIHQVSSYFVENEVAHTFLILRGSKCSQRTQNGEFVNGENSHPVIRVFLWPRSPVSGSQVKSSYDADERPTAAFEFSGFVSVETRETYDLFTEELFCKYMKGATLPEEEFTRHREIIRELLNK